MTMRKVISIIEDIVMYVVNLSVPATSFALILAMINLYYFQNDGDGTWLLMNLACLFGVIALVGWCYIVIRGVVQEIKTEKSKKDKTTQ